ncbi:hypothetical protein HDU83_002514 [Entophlyctis luteolus]|nr:hypothetical protein HDU83_002514 [Entophlyctis luteolus]
MHHGGDRTTAPPVSPASSAASVSGTSACTDTDEGFDEDWADSHPLYARPSGVQRMVLPVPPVPPPIYNTVTATPQRPVYPLAAARRGQSVVSDLPEPDDLDSSANDSDLRARRRRAAANAPVTGSSIPAKAALSANTVDDASTAATDGNGHGGATASTLSLSAGLEAGSQRNKDSVLHYFVATQESEASLDRYLTRIISSFLEAPAPVHAGTVESVHVVQERFSRHVVPHSTDVGTSLEEYLQRVKANVIDRATRVASPKQIGHMTTALPYFHRPLAKLLTAMNQNVVKLETASTTTYLERETLAMMHHEFYGRVCTRSFYAHYMHAFDTALGVFTSGGTIANITALWAARNRALPACAASEAGGAFAGVDKEGLFRGLTVYGYKGAVVLASRMAHYSFKKAVDLLGFGDDGLCLVDVDERYRIRLDALQEAIAKYQKMEYLIVAIIGIAGTTETGSIDDLNGLASIARKHRIHFHVDAAWGGPLMFSREHCGKLDGIEKADTITVDGHKQLYTPMGLGLLLFANPTTARSIRKTANYIIRKDSADLGQFTLEGSRPASSLHLHAVLHLLGRDGIESLVTRSVTLVRQMQNRLDGHPSRGFQTLHVPDSNILLYRYIPRGFLRDKVAAWAPLTESEDEAISEATRRIQMWQSAVSETAAREREGTVPAAENGGGGSVRAGWRGFVSRTRVQVTRERDGEGQTVRRWVDAFRVVLANPLTTWEDIESVMQEQLEIGEAVENAIATEQRRVFGGGKVGANSRGGSDINSTSSGGVGASFTGEEGTRMWVGWPFEI